MNTPDSPSAASAHAALQELRSQAEKRKSLLTQSLSEGLPEDVQRLVQDLQVHQIELEMQYEELLLAQAELETMRAQYVDLYDFAPVGYFSLDLHGVITQLNLKGSQQLSSVRQRLIGRRFAWFVDPEYRAEFQELLLRVQASEQRQTLELILRREDGTVFYALLEGLAVAREPEAQPTHCRVVVIDITRQHEAKKALEASEARFRRLFEHSSDAVVLLQDNYYLDCNTAAMQLLAALDREEVVGHHITDFFPERQPDGTLSLQLINAVVQEAMRQGSAKMELLMQRITGEEVWVEAVITLFALQNKAPCCTWPGAT
ncbi:PAS domain-containing protein [Hymenobacter cellulosilyticus]|uniref:PAS domain S-box protein n=1 Tax=Hymenobacter cellulosilyticus TaxID=2932248 RepID=A0A8T9Q2Q2_9BACT|nr:PAS domain-containing protein [Hymenobacter cellulosilyticus]UOQ71305.1 PAS domain S-box protein [Hymenobacter cellulosilyticus]